MGIIEARGTEAVCFGDSPSYTRFVSPCDFLETGEHPKPIMRLPRVAVAAHPLHPRLRTALQKAVDLQADGVQLTLERDFTLADMSQSARRQLRHELGERELGVSSLHIPFAGRLAEPPEIDYRLDRLKKAMQLAFDLRAPAVTFRIGPLPPASTGEFDLLQAVLNDLCRHGNHVGAIPSLIPAGDPVEEWEALLKGLTEGPVAVCLDPAVLVAADLSPVACFTSLHERVDHLLVRDVVCERGGRFSEVPVGRGDVRWDELLVTLREAEFAGWLTVTRTEGDDIPGDMQRAVQFVRTVLSE